MNFLNQSGSVNYYPSTFAPQVVLLAPCLCAPASKE